MATKKQPAKRVAKLSPEDKRKQARKKEGTASARTVSRQFNKDQSVTVFGKKIPKSTFAREGQVGSSPRPKRYNESELEWLVNSTKEDLSKGVNKLYRGAKKAKKKLGL